MKKTLLLFLLLIVICNISAKNRVVENPSYEFKTTGLDNITKIELGKNETRVYVHCTFIPKWWVSFPKNLYIRNSETGERFAATGIEGTDFDKQTFMPASGDSSFVLIFPVLGKSVRKIDLCMAEDQIPEIYGVSLRPGTVQADSKKVIPAEVSRWLDEALASSKKQVPAALNPAAFFCKDSARLVGYIKGYDVRSGFSTGILYEGNQLTREDYPIVARVFPDGRFEAKIPMNHPKCTFIVFKNTLIPFYIEPGQTLAMILDWNEFLISDRLRNIRYAFQDIAFMGPLAQINKDLMGVTLKQPNYKTIGQDIKTIAPGEFKAQQISALKQNIELIDQAVQKRTYTPEAIAILKAQAQLSTATFLFDFILQKSFAMREDTVNQFLKMPVPKDYYDFLGGMPLNDQSLLIPSAFGSFVNRFEYSTPASDSWQKKDSIVQNEFHLEPNLTYEITKIRSLAYIFKKLNKEEARSYLTNLEKGITHPFLKQEGERLFNEAFSDAQKTAYQLPEGRATDIFKKRTDPFKGKILFIDFWATTCGPCVSGIKTMKPNREKYKGNKDFDFIFITSEETSPQASYDKFVKEQELVNVYRLSEDDYNYLRQLFRFNGIPHYVVIDKDGKVLDDDFSMFGFDSELNKILGKK